MRSLCPASHAGNVSVRAVERVVELLGPRSRRDRRALAESRRWQSRESGRAHPRRSAGPAGRLCPHGRLSTGRRHRGIHHRAGPAGGHAGLGHDDARRAGGQGARRDARGPGARPRRARRRRRLPAPRSRRAGGGAIVGDRGRPAARQLRRSTGHLPERGRSRCDAPGRPALLGIPVDGPRRHVPGLQRHRSPHGGARRGHSTDGRHCGRRRALHGQPGDGPARPRRDRREPGSRGSGRLRVGQSRPLRHRLGERRDPGAAARRQEDHGPRAARRGNRARRATGGRRRRVRHGRPGSGARRARCSGRGALRRAAGHRMGDRRGRPPVAHSGPPHHDPVSAAGERAPAGRRSTGLLLLQRGPGPVPADHADGAGGLSDPGLGRVGGARLPGRRAAGGPDPIRRSGPAPVRRSHGRAAEPGGSRADAASPRFHGGALGGGPARPHRRSALVAQSLLAVVRAPRPADRRALPHPRHRGAGAGPTRPFPRPRRADRRRSREAPGRARHRDRRPAAQAGRRDPLRRVHLDGPADHAGTGRRTGDARHRRQAARRGRPQRGPADGAARPAAERHDRDGPRAVGSGRPHPGRS